MDEQKTTGNYQGQTGQSGIPRSGNQRVTSGMSTPDSAAGYPRDMTQALEAGQSDTMAKVGRTAQATWDQTKQELAKRAGQAGELAAEAGQTASSYGQQMMGYGRQACQATETYMRENPWTAVGIAAVLGLVTGLLISRR
jgi:ElaB/YqjD/DUF883 family membrane-anchored ribosome-binding protein